MNKKQQYKEEAIPLLAYDQESEKYVLNEDALDFISTVPQPIGVVGVAGMYRTGKSYLLNQMLLNRSDGFGIGPTVNPCTKGLWIWGKPLLGQTAEGDNINILVIDSEGIGALDEDSTHDSRIFALIILLSSCFIYNSVGSLDENAIQNLSLIVNLTKNIQLKSGNSESEELDYEDYAQHFPSFIWVLRDFSLQLIDSDGQQLSSKEYLENTLQPQKGFTEAVEQKNRIRKCLSNFFKDRDCQTLVRPLTNEENLQNLDKMQFDQLRPEFFEQVIYLRKRILSKMKVKKLQGRNLSGDMYSNLIKSYVLAINEGAIPNIQTAWQYLCEDECVKAVNLSTDYYDQVIKDILHNKLPLPEDILKLYHQSAKEQAIELFNKKSIGDVQDEYYKELGGKIKEKYQQIKIENEKESQRVCHNYIQIEFKTIERKLKLNDYKNYQEFEQDLILFHNFFIENGPKAANKEKFISDFIQMAQTDGQNFFMRNMQHEKEIQKTLSDEIQKKLENEIKELKEANLQESTMSKSKFQQLQQDKYEIQNKYQSVEETLNELKREKLLLEQELKDSIAQEKSENTKQMSVMKMKLAIAEDKTKENERQKLVLESEFDKERALLLQKLSYFEKSFEEMNKKDKDTSNDVKNVRKEHMNQLKEIQQKNEQQIKTLVAQASELNDKIQELEHTLQINEQQAEIQKKKTEVEINNRNNKIKEGLVTIEALQNELENYKNMEQMNYEQKIQDQAQQKLIYQLQELVQQNRVKDEAITNIKSQMQKENALLSQQVEFLEVQNREARQQLDENKKAHDAILNALDCNNKVNANDQLPKQIKDLKEQHQNDIKNLEIEFNHQKKRLLSQIELLTEKNNELEINDKFERADTEKELKDLQDQLQNSEIQIQKLYEQNKQFESERHRNHANLEERYTNKIKLLEEELEEQKNITLSDIKDHQSKSEQSLAQLKNIYEIERESLERRIAEEREKCDKKLYNLSEEYYEKSRSDQALYEDEIESLKEELRDQESNYHNIVSQYEHEYALKQQTIETLEKYITQTKESLMNLQNNNNQSLESHINNFSTERKTLLDKIDCLTQELQRKEKENLSLLQKKEQLENHIQRKEDQVSDLKQDYDSEKSELVEKLEHTKQKLQEITDLLLEHKINFSKEIALSNQKNEFLLKKNDDLQRNNEISINRYEEKLKSQKSEFSQDMREKVQKLEEDREQVEMKLEKAKKQLKEIEGTFNKQLYTLEREKAIATEKLAHLDSKKQEIEQKYKSEVQQLQTQVYSLKEQGLGDRKQLIQDLEKYKNQNLYLEQENNDLLTNYDRDKALWEGKFQFLDQQKEQAKQDLVDALKKFEVTLQHLQKARNNEKDEHEHNLNELLQSMEKKYQSQINEMNESHNRLIQDYEDKLRRLNKELKSLKENNYVEKYGKNGNQNLNEKKIQEFIENEKRLLQEIEILKSDREQKQIEYQRNLDSERENFNKKMGLIENKYKEAEHKRNQLLFEYEKERSKWNMDKDHLIQQKNEGQELVEKLEKKKELLLRENEKLRNDNKVTKRSINLLNQGVSGLANNILQKKSGLTGNRADSPHSSNGNKSFMEREQNNNQAYNNKRNITDITNQSCQNIVNFAMEDDYMRQNTSSQLPNIKSPPQKQSQMRQDQQDKYY